MQGKVLVFAANAVILGVLALLGLLLAMQLRADAATCEAALDEDATCERTAATAASSLTLSLALAAAVPVLAAVAWMLHRRHAKAVEETA